MAYTSEIEKLERRWLENPKGRNFAPLADAYRKAGELDRAIDLCKSGLEQHPDYVSAHIVYGRCLIDKKDDGEAEQVFQKVLSLDPENIIALKVLAELADRNNRFDDAVQWLSRLLNADPMNGDAAEALARAKGKAAMAAKAPEPVPAAPPEEPADPAAARPSQAGLIDLDSALAEAPTTAMGKPEFELERASAAHPAPSQPQSPRPSHGVGDLEVFDGSVDLKSVAGTAAQPEGIELAEEVELAPEAVPIEGLARTQYEGSGMFKLEASEELPPEPQPAPPPPPVDAEEPSAPVDLPLIMPEELDAQAARRTPPPRPAEPLAAPVPVPEPVREPVRRTSVPAPAPVPAAVALSDDDGAADAAALSQVEPVVTETMAELYLKQGHKEDALRVYQALLERKPDDVRLRAKVDELQGRGTPIPPPEAPRRPAAAKRTVKVGASSGQSAAAFLRSVLRGQASAVPVAAAPAPSAVPPESPEAAEAEAEEPTTLEGAFSETPAEPVPGAPTKPAGDNISLDAVFGDQGGRASVQGYPAAAAPDGGTPSPGGGGKPTGGSGGFSFDDFFGAQQAAAAAESQGAQSPQKPRPSGRSTRPSEEDGDLDQFQAWLKGLKS